MLCKRDHVDFGKGKRVRKAAENETEMRLGDASQLPEKINIIGIG